MLSMKKGINIFSFSVINRILLKMRDGIFQSNKNSKNFRRILRIFLNGHAKLNENSSCILIWDMGGYPPILCKNAFLSLALNVRGYNTHFMICDGTPEACMQRSVSDGEELSDWPRKCKGCLEKMKTVANKYNVSFSLAGDYIEENQKTTFRKLSEEIALDEIRDYEYLGIRVGEYALASYLRYCKGYPVDVQNMKQVGREVYRKYLYGSMINAYVANNAIDKFKPLSVFTSHGVYVDYAPPMFLAFVKGIKSMCWTSGFEEFAHYYSVPRSSNKLLFRHLSEHSWKTRINRPLSDKENKRLDDFIKHRYFSNKSFDISFSVKPAEKETLIQRLNIDKSKPIVCLFTHLNWDACVDFSTMLFEDSDRWVIESLDRMIGIEDVNWIIRIHPGERINKNAYSVGDNIKSKFKTLPDHIKILWADSDINTLGLYQLINAGITIFGTVGVELPLFGKPIIAAGEAHFTGKGFTIDSSTKDEYFTILKNAGSIQPLNQNHVQLARLYAYSYFFQRQIPLNVINRAQGHWGDIDLTKLNELLSGENPVIDAICDAVINGTDVILDEKTIENLYGEKRTKR